MTLGIVKELDAWGINTPLDIRVFDSNLSTSKYMDVSNPPSVFDVNVTSLVEI